MAGTSKFKEILNYDEVFNYLATFIKTCYKKNTKATLNTILSVVSLVFICVGAYVLVILCWPTGDLWAFEAGLCYLQVTNKYFKKC